MELSQNAIMPLIFVGIAFAQILLGLLGEALICYKTQPCPQRIISWAPGKLEPVSDYTTEDIRKPFSTFIPVIIQRSKEKLKTSKGLFVLTASALAVFGTMFLFLTLLPLPKEVSR